jgi:hypothetical protein
MSVLRISEIPNNDWLCWGSREYSIELQVVEEIVSATRVACAVDRRTLQLRCDLA